MKSLRRLERNKESFRVGAVIGQLEKRVRAFRDFIDLLCQATNWEQFVPNYPNQQLEHLQN